MTSPFLQLRDINKSFSGVQVLKDVTLTVQKPGTILGLVGENGAGKSTLMNILGGVLPRDSGEIVLGGESYEPRSPKDAERAGIALIHQELNLFLNMTITENLYLGGAPGSRLGVLSYRTMNASAKEQLLRVGIDLSATTRVEKLPMGVRQMVEIAKALSKQARVVIFDEPTTSLSNREKRHLFSIIRGLSENGIAMIYISHTLDDVIEICDEVAVLRDGVVVDQSAKPDMPKERMINLMVGRKLEQLYPYVEKSPAEELLRVESLGGPSGFSDVNFTLHRGEIVGLFGLMGAGRSEVVNALYGVDPVNQGSVFYKGQEVHALTPDQWIERGVAYITENRREEGLLMSKSVRDNLVLANLRAMKGRLGALDKKVEEEQSAASIERLRIRTFDKTKQTAAMLSGGNQQKVVIGKWLLTQPEVFLMDEPTRGVDVGAKFEIYNHINTLALEGSAVLFVSSEMEELIGVCDRILVMCNGSISGELARPDFDQESLLALAIRSISHEHFVAD